MTNSKTKRTGTYSEPMKRICVALEAKMFDQCRREANGLGMHMSAYLRMLIIKQRKEESDGIQKSNARTSRRNA